MSEPIVLLPFDASDLADPPSGLRYAVAAPGAPLPDGLDEVELWVPPYLFHDVDVSLFGRLPSLRVVQMLTAGTEHVVPHLPEGVLLCSGRGIHDASTAELAVTLTLASLRGIPEFERARAEHRWAWGWRPALADKCVLIVGYGSIGAAIEARLLPFECEVVRVARRARDGSPPVHAVHELARLLPDADVVILVVPATAETRQLVDAGFLAAMKPGSLLVNVGRGSVVDTSALIDALHAGRVHAALDVTDPEPLPPEHPLWDAPHLLVSHHTGGSTSAFWPRAHQLVRAQLERYAAGEPLVNLVGTTGG
ncbi:2-hydroxyacid dehydrogenase [Nocardioides bigeumensis]|uniref:2-hydroxyacid dehydrogenase n=1 Tax=Nocardioides bigeumensis TaxID=433657 RepID=A0ABN2Y7J8_9ACTN